MSKLQLKYLGDFEVVRDGEVVKLPPSKKTRALLAYLSLNPRRFRRDFLCELLWEVPDDPRGSLRWSLSKLRGLIDDNDKPRIIADRTHVEIDASDADIDAARLRAIVGNGLAGQEIDMLEDAASRLRGNFLEGLDLPNFHDYHAWCIAEREEIARAQAALLRELVGRLKNEPERALPYARSLVSISPYDEELRALLIRLLVTLGHNDEAEKQYQLGLRMLKEVGVVPSGVMNVARRRIQAETATRISAMPTEPAPVTTIELSSGLVGRVDEAEGMIRLFKESQAKDKAQFALVRGEPGIGKTRLIEAVSAFARGSGATVLNASAYESESIRPFAIWIDAIRRHDANEFGEIFDDREAGNRDRLFDRLGEFVAGRAADKPVVLVFDDIHWCDDSSAAAIHYVARTNRDRAVFGILGTREGDLRDNVPVQQAVAGLRHDGLLTEFALGPLSETELERLIKERAPGARADKLSRQCGGNPLLAIELARAEQEGASSTSFTELVSERLARFGVEGTEVLQWSAVLGPRISVETITELTQIDAARIGEILEVAERQGMLTMTSDGLNFSHDLLAKAVYTTLSPLRRQVMHRRVADLLEKNAAPDLGRAADLAHHAALSGDPGLAARAMGSAGRLCLRFYANDEALILARRGMQFVDQLPDAERVCLTIDLNNVRYRAGPLEDWKTSALEYAALAEQALDHGELGHARLGYHMAATVRWMHGQWADAREETLQSERVVRSSNDKDQIVGMAETAKCLVMIERDLPKADAMLMEAAALSTRLGFGHYALPAGRGMLRFHEGKLDEAEELLKEARTLCKSAGSRFDEFQCNEYLMMIAFQRGRFKEARAYCGVLESIGDKLPVGSEAPFSRALTALCDYALNDECAELESSIEQLRAADAKFRLAYVLTRTAQLDLDRGRLGDAARRASEALEYATLLQRATEMVLARAILARTCLANNESKASAEHDAAIAELLAAGVARWAAAYAGQEIDEKKVARK